MKLDLTYLEAEHKIVPGVLRWLVDKNDHATERKHREWVKGAGGKIVHTEEFSVEVLELWTTLEMEAALCVWEWINDVTLLDNSRSNQAWINYRKDVGSVELRHESMQIGRWALKVYDLLPDWVQEIGAYDWEIIPAIVGEIAPGDPYPDPQTAADAVINSKWARTDYFRTADHHMKWKYGTRIESDLGLTEEEFMQRWFDPQVCPTSVVDDYAAKYNMELIA